ncbi:EpsG family protein [Peribacillus frigoritolerans]|uniref:EpsG family protein n=1 Tax=Peribacillus frigoritolerans TaxID=450367 RepID=UPI00256FCFA2|nr:EpsG family protein [Peribacillus frigoritolerans]WJE46140.1 EpsG family protein [Peribacillus frigoritolerans]
MAVYLINIFLIVFFAFFLLWYNPTQIKKKLFCILIAIQWILISGLRHIDIGPDTDQYLYRFNEVKYTSWEQLIRSLFGFIFGGEDVKDPGYSLFVKVVQLLITDYQLYLILVAMIFTIPLAIYIYKNSSDPFLSFILYSCLFYSFFSITGIRQTIATAIGVFLGYKFIKQRSLIKFLLTVGLSALFHKSALILIPFYFIANKKITWKYLVSISLLIPISWVFKGKILTIMAEISGYNGYDMQLEGAGAKTFSLLLLAVLIVALWRMPIILKNNNNNNHNLNALFIAVIFVSFTFINQNAMRLVQYYSIFLLLLLPEITKSFSEEDRKLGFLIKYIITIVLIALLIKNSPYYLFFWQ